MTAERDTASTTPGCASASLQWGRGHVTAESHAAIREEPRRVPLQWGRGHVTAESHPEPHLELVEKQASMGPRSCDRGEIGAGLGAGAALVASMGPRSCDRGEAFSSSRTCSHISGLQWGRGHVTAESRNQDVESPNQHVMLQWGRGHVTAESARPGTRDHGRNRASMGPRSCDRGEGNSRARAAKPGRRFNGAAVM